MEKWWLELKAHEGNKYSQNGEDGVIRYIFDNIGIIHHACVEFGGADGARQSNTRQFINDGWEGLMMDGSPESDMVEKEWITKDNINDLFDKYHVPEEVDLMSIDIDGNDHHVWEAITRVARVIVAEYNPSVPDNESKRIVYNETHQFGKTDYYGASLLAFKKLGEKKDMTLVYYNGLNAVFVKNDLVPDGYDIPKNTKQKEDGRKIIQEENGKTMALFNEEKKYIFFHLYKCGGNSFRKLLAGEELLGVHCHAEDLKKHFYSKGEEKSWDDSFKFSMVRNPYDWQVSLYHYIKKIPSHWNYEAIKGMSLEQFLEWERDVALKMDRPHGSNKYDTLLGFLSDDNGDLLVDHIIKLEEVNEKANGLMDIIGEKHMEVPVVNVGMNRDPDYRKYYNDKSRALIVDMFGEDLDYFKYTF